jgi:hypothetical protein
MLTGLALGGASAASAQSAFSASETRIGPVLGLGGLGGAGMSIGGRFEKAIKQLPNLGDGVLSFQVSVDYYSYNDNFGLGTDWSFRYIPFSGTVNYHINLKNEKADVFVGAGLGYLSVSTSYSGLGSYSGSGIYFVGRLGGSYDIAKVLALYADVGAGAATLNAGVMINIGGK